MYHYEVKVFIDPMEMEKYLNALDQSAEVVGIATLNGNPLVTVRWYDAK